MTRSEKCAAMNVTGNALDGRREVGYAGRSFEGGVIVTSKDGAEDGDNALQRQRGEVAACVTEGGSCCVARVMKVPERLDQSTASAPLQQNTTKIV